MLHLLFGGAWVRVEPPKQGAVPEANESFYKQCQFWNLRQCISSRTLWRRDRNQITPGTRCDQSLAALSHPQRREQPNLTPRRSILFSLLSQSEGAIEFITCSSARCSAVILPKAFPISSHHPAPWMTQIHPHAHQPIHLSRLYITRPKLLDEQNIVYYRYENCNISTTKLDTTSYLPSTASLITTRGKCVLLW